MELYNPINPRPLNTPDPQPQTLKPLPSEFRVSVLCLRVLPVQAQSASLRKEQGSGFRVLGLGFRV